MEEAPEEFGPVEVDADYAESNDVALDMTQHMLLSYLSSNRELWIRCSPVLKEEYFDNEFQPVLTCLRTFELSNQILPSKAIIRADTGIGLETPDDAVDPKIMEELCDRVEEFCRGQAAVNFLINSADVINEDRSRGTVASLVTQMDKIAGISIQQDLGYDVHEDAGLLLEKAEESDNLPTGFDFLDHSLYGGVTCPSFNLVSAATGDGKSIYLQNQAVNYARDGYNVAFISLELPEFMLEKRFAAMMTEIDINTIYEKRDIVVRKMKSAGRREGHIRIKRMSITGTTVADIRAYVNELTAATGLVWDRIMIDFMDLMSPMMAGIRFDNIHIKDKAVSMELYEWTHERDANKIIWSASQQVKGAKEEKDARQSGVAGGVDKVNTCDNLIILKRTLEDVQDELCWGTIAKGRGGGTGRRVPFHWHAQTMRMTNPESMDDLYIEANSAPPSEDKKPKTKYQTDPLFQERQNTKNKDAGTGVGKLSDRIKDMQKRGIE